MSFEVVLCVVLFRVDARVGAGLSLELWGLERVFSLLGSGLLDLKVRLSEGII